MQTLSVLRKDPQPTRGRDDWDFMGTHLDGATIPLKKRPSSKAPCPAGAISQGPLDHIIRR